MKKAKLRLNMERVYTTSLGSGSKCSISTENLGACGTCDDNTRACVKTRGAR